MVSGKNISILEPFNRAEFLAQQAAHKKAAHSLKANINVTKNYLAALPPDSNDILATKRAIRKAEHEQTIHAAYEAAYGKEVAKHSSFIQRHGKSGQTAMLVLAVTSEIISFPFFLVGTLKLLAGSHQTPLQKNCAKPMQSHPAVQARMQSLANGIFSRGLMRNG